ncbi:MAG: chloride channel protein [Chromatiales bacterium]|jgi:H+/Cl- antiporter ClcA
MRQHLRRSRRKIFSLRAWKVRVVFWIGALIVGAVCALFAVLTEHADRFYRSVAAANPWAPLIITPLGLAALVWATRRLFPGTQGSGIPQAIAAIEMRSKSAVLSVRIALGKIVLTVLGIAAGASIGREGPSVHVGAAVMHSLGGIARFPAHYMERGLILAGGAAGISAAFNTPLAGIVFAIEEMSRSFEQRSSGIVTTAVVFAGLTAVVVLGNYDYFGKSDAAISDPSALLAVPLCGVVGGLLGGLFASALIESARLAGPMIRRHPYLMAVGCGLVVAGLGLWTGGQTNGTGYHAAEGIVTGTAEFDPLFPLLKIGATLASYLSGIPGGIFAPSLAAGAGIGANLGEWAPIAPVSVMVLLGMVAYFSGVVQAPITAFVIVMEMTDNQDMLLALIATSFIAHGSSHLVCPRPLYHTLAEGFIALDRLRRPPGRQ